MPRARFLSGELVKTGFATVKPPVNVQYIETLTRSTVPPLTGKNGERYTDHDPMLTEFTYTVNAIEPKPQTLTIPTPENEALLALKEVLWTLVRVVQAVLGLVELPYLIGQGVELLINGKMP